MTTSPTPPPVRFALTDDRPENGVAAPWIGPLLALGGRVARYARKLDNDRQLVVVLSVPRRDFAAALVGCGWVMNSAAPNLREPVAVFRGLDFGTAVRIVTEKEVIADHYRGLDENRYLPTVRLSGSQWLISGIRAVSVLDQ